MSIRRVAHAKELAELRQEEEKSSSDPDEDPTSRLVVDLTCQSLRRHEGRDVLKSVAISKCDVYAFQY